MFGEMSLHLTMKKLNHHFNVLQSRDLELELRLIQGIKIHMDSLNFKLFCILYRSLTKPVKVMLFTKKIFNIQMLFEIHIKKIPLHPLW